MYAIDARNQELIISSKKPILKIRCPICSKTTYISIEHRINANKEIYPCLRCSEPYKILNLKDVFDEYMMLRMLE